jgi:hypothetical protein
MYTVAHLKRKIFSPPYPLLPFAAFLVVALCFILEPNSAFRHFAMPDTDDFMRLNQVMNWLGGQGWYDLSQPRLSPGDHTVIYWSRLVDLPLAAVSWPFRLWFGMKQGVMIAALVVPVMLLGLFLFPLLPAMARPFLPRARGNLAAVMLLFAPTLLFEFMPGRVDHHAYQLLLAGFGFLCLTCMVIYPRRWGVAALAGAAFAAALWIGGESFLGLAPFITALAFAAAWNGGRQLRNAAVFGAVFAAATVFALLLARRPEEWMRLEITWFSGAHVLFAALTGAVFIAGWLLGRMTPRRVLRLALMAALGMSAGLLFLLLVPKVLEGPYADFAPLSASMVLPHVSEAQPLIRVFRFGFLDAAEVRNAAIPFFRYMFVPLLALATAVWNLAAVNGRRRMLWGLAVLYLLPLMALALFWQVRVIIFVQLFALVPVAWLVWRMWDTIGRSLSGRPRFWAEIVAFGVAGLFPAVLVPGILAQQPVYPGMLFSPAAHAANNSPLERAAVFLSDPATYGGRPRVVMSTMNEGPELLFRTPHSVLSAPYNAAGNYDSFKFFNAREEDQALEIVKRRKVELVLAGRRISLFYAGLDRAALVRAPLKVDEQGRLQVLSNKDHLTMIERLSRETPPPWLKRVEVPGDTDYLLYEVQLPE